MAFVIIKDIFLSYAKIKIKLSFVSFYNIRFKCFLSIANDKKSFFQAV